MVERARRAGKGPEGAPTSKKKMGTMKTTTTRHATSTTTTSLAKAAIAAALAATLTVLPAAPALAEGTDDAQATPVEMGDQSADDEAWDGTADEQGFATDATQYEGTGDATSYVTGTDGSAYDSSWWCRRVSPTDALSAAEDYFGVYDWSDWGYQVGRFRGTPAYRIVIDSDDHWGPWSPWGCDHGSYDAAYGSWGWWGTTRYVAFIDYFTGRVIAGYVTRA